MASLRKYHWPGNVRELENLIKRYVSWRRRGHFSDLAPRETDFFNAEYLSTTDLAEEINSSGCT